MLSFTTKLKLYSFGFFRALKIRSLSSRGVPLSYIKLSDADTKTDKSPLLIFHGLFGSKTNWRSISKSLVKKTKRNVYIFDLRNHGESPHVDGHKSDLNGMASDIEYFIDKHNLSEVNLLGHSLGGRVVAQFAFNQPEKVDKLILADISVLKRLPRTDFMTNEFFQSLKEAVKRLPSNIDLSSARKEVFKELILLLNDKFIADFFLLSLFKDKDQRIKWRFNVDSLRALIVDGLITNLEIKQPFTGDSLIIYGEKSNYVRIEDYDAIRVLLPAVQFISIPDAGHYLHIEKSNQFIDHVVSYLNR